MCGSEILGQSQAESLMHHVVARCLNTVIHMISHALHAVHKNCRGLYTLTKVKPCVCFTDNSHVSYNVVRTGACCTLQTC